jgi:hypothetical protein
MCFATLRTIGISAMGFDNPVKVYIFLPENILLHFVVSCKIVQQAQR